MDQTQCIRGYYWIWTGHSVLEVILGYGQDTVYYGLFLDMDRTRCIRGYYWIWTGHSVLEVIIGYGQDTVY